MEKIFQAAVQILRRISRGGALLAGLATVLLMIHIVADVLMRNIFNLPIPGTLAYVSYWWLPIAIFFSLAYTELNDDQIKVTIATDSASPWAASLAQVSSGVVNVVAVAALAYYALQNALHSINIGEASVSGTVVLIWPIKLLAVVGLVMYLLLSFRNLIRSIWKLRPISSVREV